MKVRHDRFFHFYTFMSFGSQLVISTTAYITKAFLKFGTKDVQVKGLPYLLEALSPKGKERERGVVTGASDVDLRLTLVCNHNSVADDPLVGFD